VLCKGLHWGHDNPHYQYKMGDVRTEHSPAEKDLGDGKMDMSSGWEAGHEPVMYPCSPESKPQPVLHQKKCSQQIEGGDPAPLLYTGETSPGVLHTDVESSAQERRGPFGVRLEEGHKKDARDGTPSL